MSSIYRIHIIKIKVMIIFDSIYDQVYSRVEVVLSADLFYKTYIRIRIYSRNSILTRQ